MDQNVVNCQLKALKCDNATSSATYRSCALVDQKLTPTKHLDTTQYTYIL
jgi:hypothetical protein